MLEDILLVFKTFLCLLSVLPIPVDNGVDTVVEEGLAIPTHSVSLDAILH
jgi:hypothetical protein